jgi:prolyl-tRNA synthetase
MGLRVLQKVERIVRRDEPAGAFELVMPVIQPRNCGRSQGAGASTAELRASRTATSGTAAAPRTREVITDIARRELQSYRQLPVNFYQIQTKFRDECGALYA